ncbi:hypothetical protein GGH94_001079 [Coemansia aciculifera]|uniref:RING-type domain-containing protein n=1 Tax=Coemansia aciculifera TaxID=417176 RepID=A0A9W8ITA9_9FUNG|nr:hypothetical protein GGH94_001079 [Coemansia aciculifera]
MKLVVKLVALAAAAVFSQCVLGLHLRKDLVEVENDAIVLVHATAVIDGTTSRIMRLPSSPAGQVDGSKGLVYILPDLVDCTPIERSAAFLAASYIRVALIVDDGVCPMEAKVRQAQYDGAVGALVYNTSMSAADMSTFLGHRMASSKPVIPVVAVDKDYGETLRLEVISLREEAAISESGRYRAIFASIYPDEDAERLSGWEISLISLVVILALCFCTSLAFHVSSSRRRIERTGRHGDANSTNKHIQTLPSCALDRLMLRTVTEADVLALSEHTTPLDAILNPNGRLRSIRSLSANTPSTEGTSCSAEGCTGCEKPHESSSSNYPCVGAETSILKGCIATCIVCIDDFVVGSKMRILPCGHNYHIECIDPWLTTKSSLCPLCKYDTREVLTDLERSLSGPRILASRQVFGNIIDSSSLYSDSESSSFMAESHEHISLSGMLNGLKSAAQGVAMPVQALSRRFSRNRRSGARRTANPEANSGWPGSQSQNNSHPFENANIILTASLPATYAVQVDGKDRSDMVEISCFGNSRNTLLDSKPSNSQSIAVGCDDSSINEDKPAAKQHNSGESSRLASATHLDDVLDFPLTRISLNDSVPSESELLEYFK